MRNQIIEVLKRNGFLVGAIIFAVISYFVRFNFSVGALILAGICMIAWLDSINKLQPLLETLAFFCLSSYGLLKQPLFTHLILPVLLVSIAVWYYVNHSFFGGGNIEILSNNRVQINAEAPISTTKRIQTEKTFSEIQRDIKNAKAINNSPFA